MSGVGWLVLGLVLVGVDPPSGPVVEDLFGRTLNEHGLIVVDWEGYMANPLTRFFVEPPKGTTLPVRLILTADNQRLYFDLPSQSGPRGPRKELLFKDQVKAPVSIGIFPDRDAHDERHALNVDFLDGVGKRSTLSLPIRVIDQDQEGRQPDFPIIVDFSKDKTEFFRDSSKREVIVRAADDWAYFFAEMHLTSTAAREERTFLWDPDGFKTGRYTTNEKAYTGFLLYAYGIEGVEVRSGGEPSRAGGFQHSAGRALPIRRSGGVEVEVRGNYNKLGWRADIDDAEWWKATNLGDVVNDLYSIVHHEIGHALMFNAGHTRWASSKLLGKLRSTRVMDYLGAPPSIDKTDHFRGTVDPESLRGAFGNEYHGRVPRGRWLITKTDLLGAEAVGYVLRETSAFSPLKLTTGELPSGTVSGRYSAALRASGGIPFYDWQLVDGTLPDGLELDRFSGELRGIARQSGVFTFTVRVRDYDEESAGKTQQLEIRIK